MTANTLRSEPRRRSRGRRRSAWSPKRLSNLRAWYDAELGQPKYSGVGAYVQLDGASTDNIFTLDSVATSFSNDIEVIMRVYVNDWTAAANQTLCGKYLSTGNQRSWRFYISTTGAIGLTASVDGTAVTSIIVTPTTPFVDATWYWLRLRLDLTNGANSVGTVEYAADTGDNTVVPTVWTANGTNTGTTIAGIFDSTAVTEVGGFANGTLERLSGRVGRFILRSGFDGTTVADFNATDCYGDGYVHGSGYRWALGLPKVYDRSANNRAPATFGSGSNQPKWLPWEGRAQVYLPGAAGNYVSAPDAAQLDVAGDLELLVLASADDWTPGTFQFVCGKWGAGGEWAIVIGSSTIEFWGDGNGSLFFLSGANPGLLDGNGYWLRATRNATTGDVAIEYAARGGLAEPSSWTGIASGLTAVGPTTAASNAVAVGADSFGANAFGGRIERFVLRDGGTTVADFNAELCGQSGYSDAYGNAWSVNRATSGRKTVVQSPTARSARSVILHGTDDWIDVPAASIPDLTGQPFSHLSIARFHGTPALNTRIVSMKDGASFASVAYWQSGANDYSHYIGVPTAPLTPVVQGLRHAFYAGGNGVDTSYHAVDGGAVATQTGLTVRDATSARIGAEPVTGGNYADMEFEALLVRNVDTTEAERGLVTAYYRGGL